MTIDNTAAEDHDVHSCDDHDDSRTRFLDAGAALLREAAVETALRSLTVRRVTARAGKSTGAFYHYWDTQADFVAELIGHLLRPDITIETDPIAGTVREAAEHGPAAGHRDLVQIFESAVDEQTRSASMRFQMLLWSSNDPAALDALAELYREYQTRFAGLYERLFSHTGAELVDGLTYHDLAVLITAALDGISIRRRIEPDAADQIAAERLIASVLLTSFRRLATQPDDLDDQLARLFAPDADRSARGA